MPFGQTLSRSTGRSPGAVLVLRLRPHAVRGCCAIGVIRPVVLGVAALHFFLDLEVRLVPEVRQVLRDLHGTLGRGEQMQRDRYASAREAWRVGGAEHLLQTHLERRGFWIAVVNGAVLSAGHGEMRGGQKLGRGDK